MRGSLIMFGTILFIQMLFITLNMMITMSFLDRFVPTTKFFKKLSDVSVTSGGIFAKRELSYYMYFPVF